MCISQSKGSSTDNKSEKIRKTRFFRRYLIYGYLESQNDFH